MGPHSVRVEPVYDGETVVGVLAVGWHRPDGKPQREVELITRVFATSAVGSIGWDRRYEALRREARTDALTELPNRRGWSEALAREVARGDATASGSASRCSTSTASRPTTTARADCELYRAKRAAHASGRHQLSRT